MDIDIETVGYALSKINVCPLYTHVPYSFAHLANHAVTLATKETTDEHLIAHCLLHLVGKIVTGDVPRGVKNSLQPHLSEELEAFEEEAWKELVSELGVQPLVTPAHRKLISEAYNVALATAVRDFGALPMDEWPNLSEPEEGCLRIMTAGEAAKHWIGLLDLAVQLMDHNHEESHSLPTGRHTQN